MELNIRGGTSKTSLKGWKPICAAVSDLPTTLLKNFLKGMETRPGAGR